MKPPLSVMTLCDFPLCGGCQCSSSGSLPSQQSSPLLWFQRSEVSEVKWHTTKYGDPYSEFVLCIWPIQSAHTQQWTHTHTVNTHPEQWAAIYAAAPREQLGVRCLAQGHLSRGIEGGESAGYLLPPPTVPAGPRLELATFQLRVRLSNH